MQEERERLLTVSDLKTHFFTSRGVVRAVDGIDFHVDTGEAIGIVGESGSGKSMTALSVLRLVSAPGRIVDGSINLRGRELLQLGQAEMRKVRMSEIAMIFQDAGAYLNPIMTVGEQIAEAIGRRKSKLPADREKVLQVLRDVQIAEPERIAASYPHQLSGGMQQRVMIAAVLIRRPPLIIADEPTTALDATVQFQILKLLGQLRRSFGLSLILISHDLAVISDVCDRVYIMYAGEMVESGPTRRIFAEPRHPYTRALVDLIRILGASRRSRNARRGTARHGRSSGGLPLPSALSKGDARLQRKSATEQELSGKWKRAMLAPGPGHGERIMTECNAISAERASVRFPLRGGLFGSAVKGYVSAVDDVDIAIRENETVALVGESGSGKTTLAMSLLGLRSLTSGSVRWRGRPISELGRDELKRFRRDIQIVFQDPYASLNPRQTVYETLKRPLALHGLVARSDLPAEIERLVDIVGLKPASLYLHRFPHEFSGGQRQRIAIARALALQPSILIADEPVSALDVSIRTQILKLLKKLKAEFGLSMLFLSHDLGVVRFIADRVAVMYLGRLVEIAQVDKLFLEPKHPYTRMLLSTAPSNVAAGQRPEPIAVLGDLPSSSNPPSGCRFRTRCPFAFDRCSKEVPALEEVAAGQSVACHLNG